MHFAFLTTSAIGCLLLFFLGRVENCSLKCLYFETVCFVLPLVLRRLKSTSTKRFLKKYL